MLDELTKHDLLQSISLMPGKSKSKTLLKEMGLDRNKVYQDFADLFYDHRGSMDSRFGYGEVLLGFMYHHEHGAHLTHLDQPIKLPGNHWQVKSTIDEGSIFNTNTTMLGNLIFAAMYVEVQRNDIPNICIGEKLRTNCKLARFPLHLNESLNQGTLARALERWNEEPKVAHALTRNSIYIEDWLDEADEVEHDLGRYVSDRFYYLSNRFKGSFQTPLFHELPCEMCDATDTIPEPSKAIRTLFQNAFTLTGNTNEILDS